ncbi:hypothetical protein ACOSQ2_030215 [Xanthoceras sorbifolium]
MPRDVRDEEAVRNVDVIDDGRDGNIIIQLSANGGPRPRVWPHHALAAAAFDFSVPFLGFFNPESDSFHLSHFEICLHLRSTSSFFSGEVVCYV